MSALTMSHGDTRVIQTTINNLTSSGLTSCTFWLTCKRAATDPDSAAIFQKLNASFTVDAVGNLTTPGVIHCTIAPADTATLAEYGVALVYDVQMKDSTGNIYTVDSGTLTLTPDVTQAIV
jgi:hypothetical protein